MSKYLVELIGTFFLVLAIGMVSIEPTAGDFAPLAVGAVLMAMIYAGGHVSGAHYNPAVTIAFVIRRRLDSADVAPYLAAQIIAAVGAAGTVMLLKGSGAAIEPSDLMANLPEVLVAEFVFTFALVFVILNVAIARGTEGNGYYGLAISAIVVAGAYAVGGISGAVFNPAVAVGICVLGMSAWNQIWIYLVANFAGAIAAAIAFQWIKGSDEEPGR